MTKTRVKDWPKNVNQAFSLRWKAIAAIIWQRLYLIKQYCHIFNLSQLWLLFARLGAIARLLTFKTTSRYETPITHHDICWHKFSNELEKMKKEGRV